MNNLCMSGHHVVVTLVQTVKLTCSQSNHSQSSVELDSHSGTCLFGSSVLVVHDHEQFVNVDGFNKKARHSNASTVDAAIAYKDPIMHSTVILMINQAQCWVHGTKVNKCPKFLSASPAKDNHVLLVHDPNG